MKTWLVLEMGSPCPQDLAGPLSSPPPQILPSLQEAAEPPTLPVRASLPIGCLCGSCGLTGDKGYRNSKTGSFQVE